VLLPKSDYASSPVTVRLDPDGKNWKDRIQQISNYAAGDNVFAVLHGASCPTYDHLDERYILQTLVNPNKHLKPFNDEVRSLMKDDKERFNRWVSDGKHKFCHCVISTRRRVKACIKLSEPAKALTYVRGINGPSTLLNSIARR
jgi:hypothetical protein